MINYSEWLKVTFPSLGNASSVKIFTYIKQAKSDTKSLRLSIYLATLIFYLLLCYCIGYVSGRFEDINSGLVAIFIFVTFPFLFIYIRIDKKIEQNIVKKKLRELVGVNA